MMRERRAASFCASETDSFLCLARSILAGPANSDRDEILVRLLREANSRDVWLFTNWLQLDEAWPRIIHRLGRARPVWELLRERHLYHVRAAS